MKTTNKDILIYGTLVNNTLDSTLSDDGHNDVLMNAWQLYDGRFGDTPKVNNFQDIINKRLTAIGYGVVGGQGCTTIANRDGSVGNPYMLVVEGNTNIKGNTHIDGDITIDGAVHGMVLDDLDDVTISPASLAIKNILYYNGSQWVNKQLELGDLDMPSGNNGDVLKYYGGQWISGPLNLSELNDVNTANASIGKVLKYVGNGKWEAGDDVSLSSLNDLSDVTTNGAAAGKVLAFDGTKWAPANVASPQDIANLLDAITNLTNRVTNLTNRVEVLEADSLWTLNNGSVTTKQSRSATAAGFYDNTVS